MFEGLPLLILVLAIVTVVGHGLWVACAWLVRLVQSSGDETSPELPRPTACPRCGLPIVAGQCLACAWPTLNNAQSRQPDTALRALAAQISRVAEAGAIDADSAARLLASIAEERTLLTQPAAATTEQSAAAPQEIIAAEVVDEIDPAVRPTSSAARAVSELAAPRDDDHAPHAHATSVPLRQRAERGFDAITYPSTVADETTTPAAPRATWTDWMAAFMEERNIRWGELVGGLLIVCCSIALVISFWSEIAERPWLKFLLFNGVTAGMFGIGFYSEYRWRLHTTSQGVLTIASLLIPLNFMAIAAFTSVAVANQPITILGEIISVALFSTFVFFAGRILVPNCAIALTAAVILPSISQLLVRRFAGPDADPSTLWPLIAIPVACYWGSSGWPLWRAAKRSDFGEEETNRLFKFLGVASFAALLPVGLLLAKTEQPMATLHELSLAVSLLGAVPLAFGLLIWQRLASGGPAGLRTAGTSIAVLGAVVSLAGLIVAWPDPAAMLPTAAVEFVVFTVVAWRLRLPAAHLVSAACLTTTYLLSVYLFEGRIAWRGEEAAALAKEILSGSTGALLVPLVMGYAAIAFAALRRWGRGVYLLQSTGSMLACTSGALAATSVGLVTWFGFGRQGDPVGASWVYLLYAAGSIALSARNRRAGFAWVGAALLLAAIWQGTVYRYADALGLVHAELAAMLLYCTVCAVIARAARVAHLTTEDSPLAEVLWTVTVGVSAIATVWLVVLAPSATAALEAGYWLWLASLWLAAAVAIRWLPAYTLTQIALIMATIFGVGAALERQAWFAEARWPWLDPRSLQAVGIGLSGLGLAWIALRFAGRRAAANVHASHWTSRASTLLRSPWLSVDRWVSRALIVLLVGIGSYAVLPGVRQELSPRPSGMVSIAAPTNAATTSEQAPPTRPIAAITNFERRGLPHEHAAGWGSWLLLGAVLAVVGATALEQRSSGWLLACLAATAVACPLVAGQFDSDMAVASALRWTSAIWLAVASTPIWARGSLTRVVPWDWKCWDGSTPLRGQATLLVLVLGLAAPLAMMVQVGTSAAAGATRDTGWPGDVFALALIGGIVFAVAGTAWTAAQPRLEPVHRESRPMWPVLCAAMALVAGAASVLGAVVYQVGSRLVDHPILGPEPVSIFARMGAAASYSVPMLMTALVLVGYALRDRSRSFALAGGLLTGAAATTAYLLHQAAGPIVFDAPLWIRLAQLNAVVGACYALGWLAIQTGILRGSGPREPLSIDFRLGTQIAIAPALLALVLGWSWADLFANPQGHAAQLQVMVAELVDAWGWIGLGLAATVSGAAAWAAGRRVSMAGLCGLLTAVAVMVAAVAGRWDVGDWLAYNTLLTGHMVIVATLLAIAWRDRRAVLAVESHTPDESSPSARGARAWIAGSANAVWIDLARVVVFVVAVREMTDNPWWPVGGFALLATTGAASAWVFQRRRYLYDAALLLNAAGSIAWLESGWRPGYANFVLVNVVLLALPVALWLAIERFSVRHRHSVPRFPIPPMHRTATRLAIGALAVVAGVGLYRDAQQMGPFGAAEWMPWAALAATAIAAVACLWEGPARNAIARLYLLGLVAVAMLVDVFDLPPHWLLWTGTMVLAAYALATSYLWSRRGGLRQLANRLRIPTGNADDLAGLTWLVPCNLFLVSTVVFLAGLIELTEHDVSLRVLAAQAVLTQVVSVALVARGDHRGILQTVALSLGAVGAVMFGWAWLVPGASGTLLHALVVLAAALAAVATLYGLGLNKLLRASSDWLAPARRLTPWLTALTAASIVAIIGTEVYQFSGTGAVAIAWPAILAVGLTLSGLCVAALAAALLPGRDPLNLSQRGRTLYVYGAEIFLALLFAHVRLTMPWLFSGFFQQYWPLVVMAIAFAGVGFAELCRRYRQDVLAEPIENTGALLPVLPVLGFWATDTNVDYSMLLLAVGVLYAGLSIARRSFGFGILAALAANGGLWYFFDRQQGLGFLDHPQVWLIPPALCVLAAAYLNRSELADAQMTTIRYLTSMTVYLSSTADIFLNGVAQAPWLPLVLGGLAIAGILAGIALRVRAFLLLGTGFLGLALCTIIWHAAVDLDQTWILYATGIVTGVLIIALFAMFEKKRREVLDVFERIRQWEA